MIVILMNNYIIASSGDINEDKSPNRLLKSYGTGLNHVSFIDSM